MNYYESKQLEDRETRLIAGGISFIIMSPLFGIVAAIFLVSTAALYVITAVVALLGVGTIVIGIKEKIERKKNINN